MGQLSILPAFFLKETICQAKADKVPQPEPFGDPTTVMLRHIPNRSDRPQQSPGVSEIFAPSIKRKPRSQVILRWEGFLNRYKSNTSIYNKLRNCNTKGWKRYPFLYLSSTSWSRRYTSAQLVELLDAKGFKAMQSASACLVTWWPLLVSEAAVWAIEATGIGWLLDVDGCCSFYGRPNTTSCTYQSISRTRSTSGEPSHACAAQLPWHLFCSNWHCLFGELLKLHSESGTAL